MAPTVPPATPMHGRDEAFMRPLGGALAVLVGVAAGALAGMAAAGLMFGAREGGLAGPTVQAAAVWGLGASFGFGALLLLSSGRADRLGLAVLAASVVRMLAALALGVTTYFALAPDARGFWVAFLGAGAGALIAETAWAMRTIHRAQRARTNTLGTPAGAAAGGAC